MRYLLVLALIGCASRGQAVPSPEATPVDGWVIDAKGPVAGAEVRSVALVTAACPCRPRADETAVSDSPVPACACPKALASHRRRLATCRWPLPARKVMHSDAQGHVAIELAPTASYRLHLDTAADVRAALLLDDGHCVPFRRDGTSNVWTTIASVPERVDDGPVLIVEVDGFATIVREWFESERDLDVSLEHAHVVSGACRGDRVELANPFQHLVVAGHRAKRFSFTGVLPLDGEVRCIRGAELVEVWAYVPGEGLLELDGSTDGGRARPCRQVQVVDRAGGPIAGGRCRAHRGVVASCRRSRSPSWVRMCQ